MSSKGENLGEKNILLFDGVCNLCNAMVRFTIKRDTAHKFNFAALQSEPAKKLIRKYGIEGHDIDSVVLICGDKHYIKSSAALYVMKELGGIWKLMFVFIYLPRPIRDFVYDLIAKTRYKVFGRRDTCMVPGIDIIDRFL